MISHVIIKKTLLFTYLIANDNKSAARPLPLKTTTGMGGFCLTAARTVRNVSGPPSNTNCTPGTPSI